MFASYGHISSTTVLYALLYGTLVQSYIHVYQIQKKLLEEKFDLLKLQLKTKIYWQNMT